MLAKVRSGCFWFAPEMFRKSFDHIINTNANELFFPAIGTYNSSFINFNIFQLKGVVFLNMQGRQREYAALYLEGDGEYSEEFHLKSTCF